MFDLGRVLKPGVSPVVNHQRKEKVNRERLLLCIDVLCSACFYSYWISQFVDILFLLVCDFFFSPKSLFIRVNVLCDENSKTKRGNDTSWPHVLDHTRL